MRRAISLLCAALILSGGALSQFPGVDRPTIYWNKVALNAASYADPDLPGSGIARGSMFVIFGLMLGPSKLEQASGFPLPTALGGTSVKVSVGGESVDVPLVYASYWQVAAILPSALPAGRATVTVTFEGKTSLPQTFQVVERAFGIFTRNEAGSGPAIVQNFNSPTEQPLNTLTEATKPGQVVTLWGTGLGAVSGDETAGPLPGDMNIPDFEVSVGGKTAAVRYKGRSGCCAGIDQVVLDVPEGLEGCYVPVAVKAGGVISNFASISVSSQGRFCSDPHGFSSADLAKASSGPFAVGAIGLMRTAFTCGPPICPVEVEGCLDFGAAQFTRFVTTREMGFLAAMFPLIGLQGPDAPFPALGTCTVGSQSDPDVYVSEPGPRVATRLDAGGAINITGPLGSKALPSRSVGGRFYADALGGDFLLTPPEPRYLEKGAYTVDNGAGGPDVGAFRATVNLPDPVVWTNRQEIARIPRSRDLTVTWSGADPRAEYVVVYGSSQLAQGGMLGFRCTQLASAGRLTIPAIVLSKLPPSGVFYGLPLGLLAVGNMPLIEAAKFQAPGLDLAHASYALATLTVVAYE